MKISIVIPVYNEENTITNCLRAIERQNIKPFEVILVDNNSSDDSAALASNFDFVKVYDQPKQGVLHARTLGFDMAHGDIIARIDADTILPEDWTEKIEAIFTQDASIAAVSGSAHYYDIGLSSVFDFVDLIFLRKFLARSLKGRCFLWGANMAVKRKAWQDVRSHTCNLNNIHEDIDLGIHLQERDLKVVFKPDLFASVSLRRVDTSFYNFIKYLLVIPKTYAHHRIPRRVYIYPVIALCAVGYWPARVLLRGFSTVNSSFSLRTLLTNTKVIDRIDPTTNIV